MSDYEITYVSDGELADEARAQLDAEVDSRLQDLGAAVSFTAPHLPRRLFYPVRKKRAAGLRAIQADLASEKIAELQTFLKKLPGVLRFAILRTAYRPEVPQTILDQLRDRRGREASAPTKRPARKTPAKPITDEVVAESIEKALSEEVK